jgi:hypothetical protein
MKPNLSKVAVLTEISDMVELPHRHGLLTLDEAKALCRREGITRWGKYEVYRKANPDCGLPTNPNKVYGVFLRVLFNTVPVSLSRAKAICRAEGLTSRSQYLAFRSHTHVGLPAWSQIARSGLDAYSFFGKKRQDMTLRTARVLCRQKRVHDQPSYHAYREAHPECELPSQPHTFYGITWNQFFGRNLKKYAKAKSNPEEQLIEAVTLAKDNGGVLPSPRWCCKHAHPGVSNLVIRHRKLLLTKFRRIGGFRGQWELKAR